MNTIVILVYTVWFQLNNSIEIKIVSDISCCKSYKNYYSHQSTVSPTIDGYTLGNHNCVNKFLLYLKLIILTCNLQLFSLSRLRITLHEKSFNHSSSYYFGFIIHRILALYIKSIQL